MIKAKHGVLDNWCSKIANAMGQDHENTSASWDTNSLRNFTLKVIMVHILDFGKNKW